MLEVCRRSNVEVHLTCQFVTTVLTPVITGNGGSTYRFGDDNIYLTAILSKGNFSMPDGQMIGFDREAYLGKPFGDRLFHFISGFRELGQRLFHRTGRGMDPTAEHRRVRAVARRRAAVAALP